MQRRYSYGLFATNNENVHEHQKNTQKWQPDKKPNFLNFNPNKSSKLLGS